MPQSPKTVVHVPKRSWRPLKKHNRLTGKCGTLVPVFCTEVIPGTKAYVRQTLGVTLPPLVADTYMSVSYKTEAFFVPARLLFGGAVDWFCQDSAPSISAPSAAGDPGSVVTNIPQLPVWQLNLASGSSDYDGACLSPGSLLDYLGVRAYGSNLTGSSAFLLNPLPALAYHMIYEWYYRSPLIQAHVFAMPSGKGPLINDGADYLAAMMPYIHDGYKIVGSYTYGSTISACLADGLGLEELRQRNFGFDYFTLGYPSNPGDNIKVQIANNEFSINSIRAANSLTMFTERNMLAGTRQCDVVAARYGADLSMGVAQMPVLLGTADYEVYNRGVAITTYGTDVSEGGLQPTSNPFAYQAGAGTRVGNAFAGGSDNIIDGFECNEHGYIMIIGSLVPRACYGSGVRRYLRRYITGGSASITELANPILQNVGYDVIKSEELDCEVAAVQSGSIFAYTEKFNSFFNFEDEVHGLFRDGSSLESFVLQRNFANAGSPVAISNNFLQIPVNYMDDITITKQAISDYGYQLDYYVEGGFLVPLYKHSMPSLQDPAYEHGKSVTVHRGGFRF